MAMASLAMSGHKARDQRCSGMEHEFDSTPLGEDKPQEMHQLRDNT
jgi:hypothetical protein